MTEETGQAALNTLVTSLYLAWDRQGLMIDTSGAEGKSGVRRE